MSVEAGKNIKSVVEQLKSSQGLAEHAPCVPLRLCKERLLELYERRIVGNSLGIEFHNVIGFGRVNRVLSDWKKELETLSLSLADLRDSL